ncbi:Uma2 family endonuclease [Kineosporia mesophila]|uniref:Uma2 family endonuclease n=1 Tax=Kineosporia mesophila TaxID=566012 RepID=A0ABP6ZP08_9ACTN|nr:Uma2 family endonuclease [Kineosporia mesophila]MCD5350060.1 Uma2 family endonuclease [Kineosporia mesophila]
MTAEPVFWTGFTTDNGVVTNPYQPLPEWIINPDGFTVEEFFELPDLPRHTELIDGRLVFLSPQSNFHAAAIQLLEHGLSRDRPDTLRIRIDVGLKLGPKKLVYPDILILPVEAAGDFTRNAFAPDDAGLVVEVVSVTSEDHDRKLKALLYAASGIRNFWLVEKEDGKPVVYVHELDPATTSYRLTGVHRERLVLTEPFDIDIDLTAMDRI